MDEEMSSYQREKLGQLQRKVGITLPFKGVSNCGYAFTEISGVTVLITKKSANPNGGFKVPTVRSYPEIVNPTNIDAAAKANEFFRAQQERDRRNLAKARKYMTGHFGPIVSTDWYCDDQNCPCSREPVERRKDRSLG